MAQNKPTYAGLGHGAAKRHCPKALKRDVIRGITKPDIRRLARRGGVKRIQLPIYDTVRDVLKNGLQEILEKLVSLLQSTGNAERARKTVTTLDVCYTLKVMGTSLYGFDEVYTDRK